MTINVSDFTIFKMDYSANRGNSKDFKNLDISPTATRYNLFENWYLAKEYLKDEEIVAALMYGFIDELNEDLIDLAKVGKLEPYYLGNVMQLDSPSDYFKGGSDYFDKHDVETSDRYIRHEKLHCLKDIYESNGEEAVSDEIKSLYRNPEKFQLENWDYITGKEEIPFWIVEGSFMSYLAFQRCYHMSHFECEIGKKLMPELDWYIVHTSKHAFAMGLNSKNEIESVMDMVWVWSIQEKSLIKYFKELREIE